MTDHIAKGINAPYIVATTVDATLETPDVDIVKLIPRGVYTFTNKKVAKRFTTDVNTAIEETVAFFSERSTAE